MVLDYGCGAGFDLFVAASLVGQSGRICGIDLTEEMAAKAKENLAAAGILNFEITKVDTEAVPYGDRTFDTVTSNGVINLTQDKRCSFSEIYRVLKPGGSLQFADVVLDADLPHGMAQSPEAWSQ